MDIRLFFSYGMLALLLFGCVSLNYTQTVDRSGQSIVTEKIDLTALLAIGDGAAEGAEAQIESACLNLTQKDQSLNCTYAMGVMSVSKPMGPNDGVYSFNKTYDFPYAVYTIELKRLPLLFDANATTGTAGEWADVNSDFSDPSSKMAASTLRAAKAKALYRIEMPGEIISVENGNISTGEDGKKRADFDALELMSGGKHAIVKSKEIDTMLIMLGLLGAAVITGAIALLLVMLRAMKR